MIRRRTWRWLATLAFASGCSAQRPALPPVSPDARTLAEIPAEQASVSALSGSVDLVRDRFGWPHVFATGLRDAAVAEGFAMARDRMMQMELFRRTASGTLAEVFGAISTRFLQSDITMRTIGLRRSAQAMWLETPPGRTRDLFEGFADGVNVYLREVRSGEIRAPRGSELLLTPSTPDWTPADSLAVLRLMELFLSFNADEEINRTLLHDRAREAFDHADPMRAPELAARRGFFSDVVRFDPPSNAVTAPDFYTLRPSFRAPAGASDRAAQRVRSGSTAMRRVVSSDPMHVAASRALAAIRRVLPASNRLGVGTNAWVVDASHSASGHALLANDPHLPLVAPSILWGVHLVVTHGSDTVDVTGTAFPGVPGVVFGHNAHVAWGITNGMFDQMDVYAETIVPGSNGAADAVRFQGRDVPLQTRIERVPNGLLGYRDITIETVPHHGPILPVFASDGNPVRRTGTSALSVRWVATEPTHETESLTGLLFARDVASAQQAVRTAEVPSLGFVFADTTGAVAYRATGLVPIRAPGALTFDPVINPDGTMPATVLPGTGEAEWTGYLDADALPALDGGPQRPWIAAANNDPAGLSRDGNPFDENVYLGYDWSEGFRAERIAQRLAALGDHATREDMESIQGDHVVLVARRFLPFLFAAIVRLQDAWDEPGSQPDLAAVAHDLAPRAAFVREVKSRLADWTFDTPSGLDDAADDRTRRDAVAASLFHAWLSRVLDLTLSDELDALRDEAPGATPPPLAPEQRMIATLFLLEHPDRARTRDAASGESAIWDDLRTPSHETRDEILLRALVAAGDDLALQAHDDDVDHWTWGTFHTVRFASLLPHFSLSLGADLSIPPPGDPIDPNGFARPGGIDSVDQAWPTLENADGALAPVFTYGQGPARRFTVEMAPEGPHAFDSLPGGESGDLTSPHFRDEAEGRRENRSHALPRTEAEVAQNAEGRLHWTPER